MTIRNALERDLARVVEIYNAAVPTRKSTADTQPVSIESRSEWFHKHDPERRPLLVYEKNDEVVAWMSFEDFYGRPAYRHTAELSIYIAPDHQGQHLGRNLLSEAMSLAPTLGVKALVGYVFSHNLPSLGLLQAFGFQEWGRLPDVAEMDGKEFSLCIMGKRVENTEMPSYTVQ
ncbi:N-acetyltransferase family protein [Franzmannia qiaohouensis]|uniref:GNAT family N-acetyltransferase n=1 Tax=Franzmannia qiaohouensis TaxID=1329370 RepID=A0ABU1HJX1_9GAMM|nr:N-acetyltransferase family protein [Halomonas qiaohouensis]MDR5907775.1 GNAT family N-acetyltransferase [Halomonas qiaohouensis]